MEATTTMQLRLQSTMLFCPYNPPPSRIHYSTKMLFLYSPYDMIGVDRVECKGVEHMYTLSVHTNQSNELVDITKDIQSIVQSSNVQEGIVVLVVPHTTAAITINENADPDVTRDILLGLSRISPNHKDYRHYEGNSDAHIKSSIIGVDQTIIIDQNKLVLGTWQGIYFCEFDGPRHRLLHIQIIPTTPKHQ